MHIAEKQSSTELNARGDRLGEIIALLVKSLTISENDLLNTELETEHWQDRIDELIPLGVSQFFFFDGEDIQKLADDSSHDLYLAESIKSLLGINLVRTLAIRSTYLCESSA